jgi:hypothetical protein
MKIIPASPGIALVAVFNSATEGNGPANTQDRAAALQKVQQPNDAELQAMLGSNYPKYQEYRETMARYTPEKRQRLVDAARGCGGRGALSLIMIGHIGIVIQIESGVS